MKQKPRTISMTSKMYKELCKWAESDVEKAGIIPCNQVDNNIIPQDMDLNAFDDALVEATREKVSHNLKKYLSLASEFYKKEPINILIHTHPGIIDAHKSRGDENSAKLKHKWAKETFGSEVILGIATKKSLGFWEIGEKNFNRLSVKIDGKEKKATATEKSVARGVQADYMLNNVLKYVAGFLTAYSTTAKLLPDAVNDAKNQAIAKVSPVIASIAEIHQESFAQMGICATVFAYTLWASLRIPSNKTKLNMIDKSFYNKFIKTHQVDQNPDKESK